MKMSMLASMAASLLLAACSEGSVERPGPAILTSAANGHYCQMTVVDHPGPKAQVHLANQDEPLWFTQVRDAFAYQRSPESSGEVTAVYVSNMAEADSWEEPGLENWIDADTAYYVTGSVKRGGMGAPELVPFADAEAAAKFASHNGGTVIQTTDIDDAMVLAPVDVDPGMPHDMAPHGDQGGHDGNGGHGQTGGA